MDLIKTDEFEEARELDQIELAMETSALALDGIDAMLALLSSTDEDKEVTAGVQFGFESIAGNLGVDAEIVFGNRYDVSNQLAMESLVEGGKKVYRAIADFIMKWLKKAKDAAVALYNRIANRGEANAAMVKDYDEKVAESEKVIKKHDLKPGTKLTDEVKKEVGEEDAAKVIVSPDLIIMDKATMDADMLARIGGISQSNLKTVFNSLSLDGKYGDVATGVDRASVYLRELAKIGKLPEVQEYLDRTLSLKTEEDLKEHLRISRESFTAMADRITKQGAFTNKSKFGFQARPLIGNSAPTLNVRTPKVMPVPSVSGILSTKIKANVRHMPAVPTLSTEDMKKLLLASIEIADTINQVNKIKEEEAVQLERIAANYGSKLAEAATVMTSLINGATTLSKEELEAAAVIRRSLTSAQSTVINSYNYTTYIQKQAASISTALNIVITAAFDIK